VEATREIGGLLFDTSAADPLTFGVTAFALAGVAALACLVPAIRATRIAPVIALRRESLKLDTPFRIAYLPIDRRWEEPKPPNCCPARSIC
jgi:hypothetical protein